MVKISDDSKISREVITTSNVFYDTFAEVVEYYKGNAERMEVWEETCTIALYDTDSKTGLFDNSDIIVVYDMETHLPTIVTERIFRKNYSRVDWLHMKRYLKHKLKIIKHELGYNLRISYSKDYIDYVHYKEEWWQWALKRVRS